MTTAVRPGFSTSVAHRNASLSNIRSSSILNNLWSYGVPTSKKILTVDLFIKRYDEIRRYLAQGVGLTPSEREAILRLLRIYCYYGRVYPKASQIAEEEPELSPAMAAWRVDQGLGSPPRKSYDCSKRSFWRAIAKLREGGFIQVGNRFLHGRQISNTYRLDKLVICLVRYLMEHGSRYLGKISRQLLDNLANPAFWRLIYQAKVNLAAERLQFKFI
ncbi:hypothetical protein ES705_38968 [subsurface metagenome]